MTLLDQISQVLGANDNVSSLMSGLRTTEADTRAMLGSGVPAVLAGLGQQSAGGGGQALHGLVSSDGGGLFDRIGDLFSGGDSTGLASGLVGSVFGGQRNAIETHVAADSGVDISVVSRFLPLVAPAVMSLLGKIGGDENHDAEALSSELALIGADGPLGDIIAASSDDDRSGFVSGLGSLTQAGGLAALVPAAATATAGRASLAAASGGGVDAGHAIDADGEGWIGGSDRSGLAWLIPVLALLGLLIVGLVLWQCSNSGVYQPAIDAGDGHGVGADDHGNDAEMADDPEPTPEPEPTPTPEPEPEPEPTPTPEPAPTTLVDLALGDPNLSGMAGLAVPLAAQLGDPGTGPYTILAPGNAALANAAGVVDRLDDAQMSSVLGFHVIEGVLSPDDLAAGGEFETLAGERLLIGPGGALPNGLRIVDEGRPADNGVLYTIDGVMVPGSVSRGLVTQDINALFELEPIQFAVSSAEILPESTPTLDNAVQVLLNAPAGTLLEVAGHTDSDGAADLNQVLSEQRANSVVAYLTDNGVDSAVLVPVGKGETELKVDPELTADDKFTNRRIEFTDITP